MEGAIVPLTELTNRAQKRRFIREATKIAGVLEEINTSFIWYVFNAPKGTTYQEIYTNYLNEWQDAVASLAANKKFTHCAIDVLFFERNYKPQIYIK
jgi:hypothetical protein